MNLPPLCVAAGDVCGAAGLLAQLPWEHLQSTDAALALSQLAGLADALAARVAAGAGTAPGVCGALNSLLAVIACSPSI